MKLQNLSAALHPVPRGLKVASISDTSQRSPAQTESAFAFGKVSHAD
jgi:hypothetical protein